MSAERKINDTGDTSRPRESAAAQRERLGFTTYCVSTYTGDLATLDEKVAAAKARGYTKATRSSLIRAAVAAFDVADYRGEVRS